MKGLIPENILEDVLSRVDIVEVISGYMPLKRAGRNFKANCPFHHEKTPSFMVSPDRQIYHCFGCGESGNAFKFLMRHERMEFPEAVQMLAKKAGLIIAKDGGGYYDRFRNRIIFPILDIKSRPVGFGARVMDEGLPKYINSPETPVYVKGRNLYGLHLSKDNIRDSDEAIIVEGYLDFIIPYQHGLRNIVASQGTAFTIEQARLIKRYTQSIVMVYDADAAGELAALRSLDIFVEEEMSVRVVSLPKGFDPDLYVRKHGADSLQEKVKRALGLFDYKLTVLKSRYNIKDIEDKAKVAASLLFTINKIKNAVLKSEYVKRLSQELDIREDALWQEAKKIKEEKSCPEFNGVTGGKKVLNIHPTEKLLIKLMLEESQLIHKVKDCLEPADFKDARVSRIMSIMFDLMEQGKDIEPRILINQLGDEDISQVICESMFLPEESTLEHKEKIVDECIHRLKDDRLKLRKKCLYEQIKIAEDSGEEEKLRKLMEEFHCLTKKR